MKEMMGRLVRVSKKYTRSYDGSRRRWNPTEWYATGWVVGFRTIQDGHIEYEYGEYGSLQGGPYWVLQEHKECVLVCTNPRQNPVKVPIDSVKLLDKVTDNVLK